MSGWRIHLHENSGLGFPTQLSRELARRGHSVLHSYMAGFDAPKGAMEVGPADPTGLRIEGIGLGRPFAKYSYLRRFMQERQYGEVLAQRVAQERPDVFFGCNTPPAVLVPVQRVCRRLGIRFVFWSQDLYGEAIEQILGKRFLGAGRWIADYFRRMEQRLLRQSDHSIVITDDFLPLLAAAGLPRERVSVIHNWAALEDLPVRTRGNAWAEGQGLSDRFVFLYSGTLGLKHDPERLLALARRFQGRAETVVITEGIGAEHLARESEAGQLPNLRILPYQPFNRMADVLASADVLLAMLEPSAGVFSVPSKVLTYLCAQRPVLLSAPLENLAAQTLLGVEAGLAVDAGNHAEYLEAAERLFADAGLRLLLGANGRAYAERNFPIRSIADRIEALLRPLMVVTPLR